MQNKDTVMRFYTFSASIMNLGYKKSCRNFWEGYPGSFFSKFIPLQESIIKKSPPNNGHGFLDSTMRLNKLPKQTDLALDYACFYAYAFHYYAFHCSV